MSKSVESLSSVELLAMLMHSHDDPEIKAELIRRGLIYDDRS